MHYILIPCKALREGKSRLASVLSAAEREKLCANLLRNSLRVALTLQSVAEIRVITPDSDARDIAKAHGVATIDDRGVGLNAAVRQGLDAILKTAGTDAAALILPVDLPFATTDAVGRAFSGTADVVLAPDTERRGTNLLFLRRRALSLFAFAFGEASFAAHRDGATRAGLNLEILDDPRLAFDLDEPDDYHRWLQKSAGF